MTTPKLSKQIKGVGRVYRNRNYGDRNFISVTTALKVLDKPALVGWAARTVAEEAIAQLPYWIRAARQDKARAVHELKGKPYATRDKAADLGSAIHAAAEAHMLGKPHAVPDDVQPFLNQYLAWVDDFGVELEAAEATVANPGNGYAGTGDLWARLRNSDQPDRLWLVDNKTSSTRPVDSLYPEYAYQLAALRACPKLWLPDHSEIDAPHADGCAVLNLRPDGYCFAPVRQESLDDAYDVFLSCLRIAERKQSEFFDGPMMPALAEKVAV